MDLPLQRKEQQKRISKQNKIIDEMLRMSHRPARA
jgi:hypothetical protein